MKENIKLKKILLMILFIICMTSVTTNAHSGRTDSRGGHKDNNNVSGLGSYHYHHGYSAHLHDNGICPYGSNNGSTSINEEPKVKTESLEELMNKYYIKGFGMGSNGDNLIELDDLPQEVIEKYKEGYQFGYSVYMTDKKEEYYNLGVEDAINYSKKKTFDETVKTEFIEKYNNGYDGKISELKNKYTYLGFEDSLLYSKIDTAKYSNEKEEEWYLNGFNNGKSKLEDELKTAYNRGYNNELYIVPTELELVNKRLLAEYDMGKSDKKSEILNKYLIIITISLLVVGTVNYILIKYKNKNKK